MAKNHLRVSIDPLKMKCGILNIKNPKTGVAKKCLVFPIEDNDFYTKVGEDGKVVVRMSFDAWENDTVSQYGDTHMVKLSHTKEWNENHNDEQKRAEPILGNARPIMLPSLDQVNVPDGEVILPEGEATDDLPF